MHCFKESLIGLFIFSLGINTSQAQIGIGTTNPNATAELDVTSTTKGLLIPRLSQTQMGSISSPAAGLQVYNTTQECLFTYDGSRWISEKKYNGKFVDYGDTVELGNIRLRMLNTGSVSLQIATITGSISISGTSLNNVVTSPTSSPGGLTSLSGYTNSSITFNTTFKNWQTITFGYHGSTQEIIFMDETNNRAYRAKLTVGGGYLNNFIEIEQLY